MHTLTLVSLLLACVALAHSRTLTTSEIDLLQRILDDSRREQKPEERNMVSESDSPAGDSPAPAQSLDDPLSDDMLGFMRQENDFGCSDRVEEGCGEWKTKGYCESQPYAMDKWCHKTCGCRQQKAPSTKDCDDSAFGCCWNEAEAKGPHGEGCPPCENKRPDLFCSRMKGYCEAHSSIDFMRDNCGVTCGYCDVEVK